MAVSNLFSVAQASQRNTSVQLKLEVSQDKITLMETINLTLTLREGTFNAGLFTCMRYLIGWKNQIHNQSWELLAQVTDTYNNVLIRKPGKWEVQVEAVLAADGRTIRSNRQEIEVRFPHRDDIRADAAVVAAMNVTWANTKNAASAASRQEFGFWIYYDTRGAGVYFCGTETPGDPVAGCANTNGSVKPGSPNAVIPTQEPLVGGRFYVAHFHTHTPLTFCPAINPVMRTPVGPSPSDESWGTSNKTPGLVFDYSGRYNASFKAFGITSGHNINDPAQVYTFGLARRKTPNQIYQQ